LQRNSGRVDLGCSMVVQSK